jgi:hypothetical protein
MNADERSLLQQFLGDLVATRGAIKDQEADGMITDALRRNPDGAYVLVQHAVMSDQALHAAQAQIAQLQDQLRQLSPQQSSSGFLPNAGPWSGGQQQQQRQQPGGFMGSGPFRGGGGLGSFLRSAGTTAAGVVGGSLLFEGLSGLFGGHGGGFGGLGGFGGGGGWGGQPTEVVNNYYDDGGSGGGGDFGGGDFGGGDGGGFDNSGGGGDF